MVDLVLGDEELVGSLRGWQDESATLLAPAHFRPEVANALLRSVRLHPSDGVARIERLVRAGVDIVDRGVVGLVESVEYASRHGLTVYDAAYLAMAVQLDGELATRDKALARAARQEGVEVID